MDITLNKFYHVTDIDPKLLLCQFIQVGLPTEIVITEAGFQTPDYGRVYYTDYYLYKGKCYLQADLCKVVTKETGGYKGCYEYPQILMTEVWGNSGDDGHTCMYLAGYGFVTLEDWEDKEKKNKINFEGLPKLMGGSFEENNS